MIKSNITIILICSFVYLMGLGTGAAITDWLSKWTKKGDENDESKNLHSR